MIEVTAPDGSIVNFPDDMSVTAMTAAMDAKFGNKLGSPSPVNQGGNVMNSLAQGATFGFADEIGAGAAAGIGKLLPESMGGLPSGTSFADAYSGIREGINDNRIAFEGRNPKTALGAELVGGIATGGMGLAKTLPTLAPKGAGIARNMLATGGVGAIEGGIAGAGYADEGNRLEGAGTGAAIGAGAGAALGVPAAMIGKRMAKNQLLDEVINTNPDARTAGYTLNEGGKRIKDKAAREAAKQGLPDGAIASIKSGSGKDRINMQKAMDILVKGRTNDDYRAINRPSDTIGDMVLERFKVANAARKQAGTELNTIANGLKGRKVDTMGSLSKFANQLDEMGISYDDAGKLDFTGSDIEGLPVRSIINKIVKRLDSVTDDANDVHKFKQWVDELVSYGKQPNGALTGNTDRLIKELRHNMDAALDNSFPAYKKVNDTYASTRGAIDDFMKAAGTRFNPESANANARVGTLARRILSNAQSRIEVRDTMQALEGVARDNGGKFTDDIIKQTVFVDNLETLFGNFGTTSLGGEVGKVSARDTANLANSLRTKGAVGAVTDFGADMIDKSRGRNEQGLIDSISVLLGRAGGKKPSPLSTGGKRAIRSPGGKQAGHIGSQDLPMDEASRMQRARDMGFDTDEVLYHGSGKTASMDEINPEFFGKGADQYGPGFYQTTVPTEASGYAMDATRGQGRIKADSPGVIPAYSSMKNYIDVDPKTQSHLGDVIDLDKGQVRKMLNKAKALKRGVDDEDMNPLGDHFESFWDSGPEDWMLGEIENTYTGNPEMMVDEIFDGDVKSYLEALSEATGMDGLRINFDDGLSHIVSWKPNQTRSKFAKFDPSKKGSPNLLANFAGLAGTGAAGAYGTNRLQHAQGR